MPHAIHIRYLDMMCFVYERPEIRDDIDVEVIEDALIEIPPIISHWPHGPEPAQEMLCRSVANPLRYKLFMYRDEFDHSEFTETGIRFGGIFSTESWVLYAQTLAVLEKVRASSDNDDDGEGSA